MRPLQAPLLSESGRLRKVSEGGQPIRELAVEVADPDAVQRIQAALNQLGFNGADGKPLKEDGKYGANTIHAVRQFQKTVFTDSKEFDGRVGAKTIDKLDDAVAQQRPRPRPQIELEEKPQDIVVNFSGVGNAALEGQPDPASKANFLIRNTSAYADERPPPSELHRNFRMFPRLLPPLSSIHAQDDRPHHPLLRHPRRPHLHPQ